MFFLQCIRKIFNARLSDKGGLTMGPTNYLIYLLTLIYLNVCAAQQSADYFPRGYMENSVETMVTPALGRNQKIVTDTNRKPNFKYCETYKPSIQEEQTGKIHVIKVNAEDLDPPDHGGSLSYKIVMRQGDRAQFSIDNNTGDIFAITPFDRDEPTRQKEIYLTVQATDNGIPPLSDLCTFKITVLDINDNVPSFDSQEYKTNVAEGLKETSEVMRVYAYDSDAGENARLTYSLDNDNNFLDYFAIDANTGVITLKKSLSKKIDTIFTTTVRVRDNGIVPLSTEASLTIHVVGSEKKRPDVKAEPPSITLQEDFNQFASHLVTITAQSNIDDPEIAFDLIKGKTAQTNKDQTFILTPKNNSDNVAYITLVRPLDYEIVTQYTLTVRVKNKDSMDATIDIPVTIEDVNDETPTFIELLKGSVVENDDIGAQAMKVRAIDKDGTTKNNIVSYELVNHNDSFWINNTSGDIKSRKSFDREDIPLYHLQVKAYDNSPSSFKRDGEPNSVIQTFQIVIEDRNDNKPIFMNSTYYYYDIPETASKSKFVGEVRAEDKDTASQIKYYIVDGNIGDAFAMEENTGRITVQNELDFEKIEKYNLTVRAYDTIYDDFANVIISIQNENDVAPVFLPINKTIVFEEEKLIPGCILHVTAYDPDIKDRDAPQEIVYQVDEQVKDFLTVSSDGCVQLTKKLDRDKPYGSPTRQVYIYAYDNNGVPKYLQSHVELEIKLVDINDNAPFLKVTEIVWYENEPPGKIMDLTADDYDSEDNGPPFTFKIYPGASDEIQSFFRIEGNALFAQATFDREEKKYYNIPIEITDSGIPAQTGTSILKVIIGDRNDNEAKDGGESNIFVYKYEGLLQDISIGRVYVNDPDDWDLPDKSFRQLDNTDYFRLARKDVDNGMLQMMSDTPKGSYTINFEIDEIFQSNTHTVTAVVFVTVKEIPEEAVRKSGSIRIQGLDIEDIVDNSTQYSKKDLLQQRLSKMLNTSLENVDVFTVLPSPLNASLIDVRFSAHGSPYYAPEKLNNKITEYQNTLETDLGGRFVMVGINECLNDTACPKGSSCSNKLMIKDEPAVVFTNKTSFVGVKAIIEAVCDCSVIVVNECFNGGTMNPDRTCACAPGFEGPYCETLGIGFKGDGWSIYPAFDSCNKSDINFEVTPNNDNGLIFYAGPLVLKHAAIAKDFISLELKDGFPLLKIHNGLSMEEVTINKKIRDGASHRIKISYSPNDVMIEIDDCKSACTQWKEFQAKGLLTINGPLQIGGLRYPFPEEEAKSLWNMAPPTSYHLDGCIRNFTYNSFFYNLGMPSDAYHAYADCNFGLAQAVTFGINSNFLVAILVCFAILLILLLAVVVHRRKQDDWNHKEMDGTRETIIDYQEEGGGEYDTGFDMNVLRRNLDNLEEKPIMTDNSDVPQQDIGGFLDGKKDDCDKDPDNLPYDDVRHYAYEGDGNSTGSLSSLASYTDEGDMNFSYLPSFGPRFRKLADMYGEPPSDEDSNDGGEESWC